jgi:hypothetical protein
MPFTPDKNVGESASVENQNDPPESIEELEAKIREFKELIRIKKRN